MQVMVLRLAPLSQQVQRSADAIEGGAELLAFIRSRKVALVSAAREGRAPVGAISEELMAGFPTLVRATTVRQFIGTAVKSVLDSAGYEVAQSGVRLPRDPVFTTGSLYRKRPVGKTATIEGRTEDLFSRLVESLRTSERRMLIRVLKRSLGEAEDE